MKNQDKTKSQLIQELSVLQRRNNELETLEVNHKEMEKSLRKQTHDLSERMKEINCLYGISRIVEMEKEPFDEIYQRIVELLPSSWQFPEITCAQLSINGKHFQTNNYKNSRWKQSAEITAYQKSVGTLTVFYLDRKPKSDEGPFLKEERFLINAIAERLGRLTEHKHAEEALLKQTHDLKERVKEMDCLYGISKLVEKAHTSLEEIYQGIANLIPASWQFPKITCAQLTVNKQEFKTYNYIETKWKQSADVFVYDEHVGSLCVSYIEEKPKSFEGPFLKEERALLNDIAERLGHIIERKRSEKALNESERKLRKQNRLLQDKNIALREIMNQLIMEKNNLEERVLANADKLIIPLLKKLKNKTSQSEIKYVDLLEEGIKNMTSSFGGEISKIMPKLTPRETEICNMIKNGLSSKEIGRLLNISYRSVETYRNSIRKKLGLINKKVNLTSFLSSL